MAEASSVTTLEETKADATVDSSTLTAQEEHKNADNSTLFDQSITDSQSKQSLTSSSFIQPASTSDEVDAAGEEINTTQTSTTTNDQKTEAVAEGKTTAGRRGAAAGTVTDAKSKQMLKDRAAKIYKQHMEIVKLRHELEGAMEEKKTVEQEIKSRNEEVYTMNEKMIFMEFEK